MSTALEQRLRSALKPAKGESLSDWADDWKGFLETHTKIKRKGKGIVHWRFNKAQNDAYDRMKAKNFSGIIIVILKIRQETGMTTWCEGMGLCYSIFKPGRNVLSVVNRQDTAEKQFRDMPRIMYRSIPDHLRPVDITNNTRQLGFENDSYYDVCCASEASNRGGTVDMLHFTEASRFTDAAGTFASIEPSMPRDERERPTGIIIIETTAHGYDWFHEQFTSAYRGAPGYEDWEAVFYGRDWFWDEENNPDHKIFLNKMRAKHKERFVEEYPNTPEEAFIGSGSNFINPKDIEWYYEQVRAWGYKFSTGDPIPQPENFDFGSVEENFALKYDDYGSIEVFKKPIQGHLYIMCGDVAEGKEDGDFQAGGIIDRMTDELVCIYRSKVNEVMYARHMNKLGRVYNNAWAVIENNGPGHAVMMLLDEMEYPHMYMDTQLEKVKKGASAEPGIRRTTKTKHMIMTNLQEWIEGRELIVPFAAVIDELKTLIKLNGKIEARSRCHDDLAVMLANGLWVHSLFPITPRKKAKEMIRGGTKEFLFLARDQASRKKRKKGWNASAA